MPGSILTLHSCLVHLGEELNPGSMAVAEIQHRHYPKKRWGPNSSACVSLWEGELVPSAISACLQEFSWKLLNQLAEVPCWQLPLTAALPLVIKYTDSIKWSQHFPIKNYINLDVKITNLQRQADSNLVLLGTPHPPHIPGEIAHSFVDQFF